jgi:4-hydroxy-4-methyl-2-oxoglutarate aldolase
MSLNSLQSLGTSAVCDAMGNLGLGVRSLSNKIKPLFSDKSFCVGYAFTIIGKMNATHQEKLAGMAVMEEIKANQIILIDTNGGNSVAHWGELMSVAAIARGAVGIIVNGGCRDVLEVKEMNFPVFCEYTTPCEALTLYCMKECNIPIFLENSLGEKIKIEPNDIIFADADGIVVIPKTRLEQVVAEAEKIKTTEKKARALLANGHSVLEVFGNLEIA